MTELKEVPTEELLSFQDYPTTHAAAYGDSTKIDLDISPEKSNFPDFIDSSGPSPESSKDNDIDPNKLKSFWSVEYFQQFFDVDTIDVKSRILGSILPTKTSLLRNEIKLKPDLYGPFWIAVTLIFTIAISGNIANYLQYANTEYHWKYDFHLVSYAATTIFIYISIVPICLWAILKWSLKTDQMEELRESLPSALELVCIYGYSLFIYIPISILWTIQVNWLQWILVLVATAISGSMLLFTLSFSLESTRHKIPLGVCIVGMHLLLAAGFMLCFFHVPNNTNDNVTIANVATTVSNAVVKPTLASLTNKTH